MTSDERAAVHRLALGDPGAAAEIVAAASTSDDVTVLVAAALVSDAPAELLGRAERVATSTRDRQLVAIAAAHRRGARDLVDVLVREHLVDHPDSVVAAWIAAANQTARTELSDKEKS